MSAMQEDGVIRVHVVNSSDFHSAEWTQEAEPMHVVCTSVNLPANASNPQTNSNQENNKILEYDPSRKRAVIFVIGGAAETVVFCHSANMVQKVISAGYAEVAGAEIPTGQHFVYESTAALWAAPVGSASDITIGVINEKRGRGPVQR